MTDRAKGGMIAALAILLVFLMPSGESLWIDEAQTVQYACQTIFHGLIQKLATETISEVQMPLSMMVSWVWARLTGCSEWALRSINILWAMGAVLCFFILGRQLTLPWLPLLMVLQPFLWFYVNEARPYALQIAAGSWLLVGSATFIRQRGQGSLWAWSFVLSAVLLCGSSLFGVITCVATVLPLTIIGVRHRWVPQRRAVFVLVLGVLLLILFGIYYLHTLLRGAGGAKLWHVGVGNLAFSIYELGGFAGLGPGRIELRSAAREGMGSVLSLLKTHGMPLILLVVSYSLLFLKSVMSWRDFPNRIFFSFSFGVVILGLILMFGLSWLVGFPFWGRHLAPLLPFFILGLATALACWRLNSRTVWKWLLPLLLVGLLLASSVSLRYAERHRKENYRMAVALAKKMITEKRVIWWAADRAAAKYYGLDLREEPGHGGVGVLLIYHPTEDFIRKQPNPDLVFFSKADLFDKEGCLTAFLVEKGYSLLSEMPGFRVWERDTS